MVAGVGLPVAASAACGAEEAASGVKCRAAQAGQAVSAVSASAESAVAAGCVPASAKLPALQDGEVQRKQEAQGRGEPGEERGGRGGLGVRLRQKSVAVQKSGGQGVTRMLTVLRVCCQ